MPSVRTRAAAARLLRRWIAAGVIAALSSGLAMALRVIPLVRLPFLHLNEVIYDSLYALRPPRDMTGGNVVVVGIDQQSLDALDSPDANPRWGWPWPRTYWAALLPYLEKCGAKAVAFDLLFDKQSVYAHENDDDANFAQAIDDASLPACFASVTDRSGRTSGFAPAVKKPVVLGATDVEKNAMYRFYRPVVSGHPSLAVQAVRLAGYDLPRWSGGNQVSAQNSLANRPATGAATGPATRVTTATAGGGAANGPAEDTDSSAGAAGTGLAAKSDDAVEPGEPFLLHFYGPHATPAGTRTFNYVRAAAVLDTALNPEHGTKYGLSAETFRDKIVLVGATAPGLYDVKSTPLSQEFPGVEIHATAIENLIRNQQVYVLSPGFTGFLAFACAALAAVGALLPRRASLKLLGTGVAFAVIVGGAAVMFTRPTIYWLPWAAPLVATLLSVLFAFAWSYLIEDRQRRLILKAFSHYVSPAVVEEISRDPEKLKLGGEKRNMTVMFTDIAGFTDISEELGEEKTGKLLNHYLDEMSAVVFEADGTVDKYIGDAIMCFWNAPVDQHDHAALACRTALAMRDREAQLQPTLREYGAERIFTRIGITSGPMICGNMGSKQIFNYSVIGDSVNLANRLEGSNKLYGTQIMIGQPTADLVKGRFLLRRLDVLRVKGKQRPMNVYELVAELPQGPAAGAPVDEAMTGMILRVARYEAALREYQLRRWDDAEGILLDVLRRFPQDKPSAALLARIARFRHAPPPADWDGVYVATEK